MEQGRLKGPRSPTHFVPRCFVWKATAESIHPTIGVAVMLIFWWTVTYLANPVCFLTLFLGELCEDSIRTICLNYLDEFEYQVVIVDR